LNRWATISFTRRALLHWVSYDTSSWNTT